MVEDKKREGLIDSRLSLGERILETDYRGETACGEKPESVKYYKDELFKIKDEIKSQVDNGADLEEAICNYMGSKKHVKDIPLTEALTSEEINCVSSTALHLILAEMLDPDFEEYEIGSLSKHVFVRKKEKEGYKNIDYGKIYPDNTYTLFKSPLRTLPKELILSSILNNAGIKLCEKGEYKTAIKFLDKAIKMDSKDARTYYNKGRTLYCNEEYLKAIEAYDKSLEIEPTKAISWGNKGNSLYFLERYTEAIESYDKALEINPDCELVKQNKKITLSEMKFKGIKNLVK